MKFIESHKKRVQKVQEFTEKNKVFTVIAIILVIYLVFSLVNGKINGNNDTPNTVSEQSEAVEETSVPETEDDGKHWRFYWIDLWILAGAGGFCTVMIIKERKKAREKLQ